jgi:hypothetical protein
MDSLGVALAKGGNVSSPVEIAIKPSKSCLSKTVFELSMYSVSGCLIEPD